MSDGTQISWCDATWPVVVGCDKISPGCQHCWAINDSWRLSHNPNPKVSEVYAGTAKKTAGGLNWTGVVRPVPQRLDWPLRWRDPRRIFVCSQADLFHEGVPDDYIDKVFAVMAMASQHTFQLLTKRADRLLLYFRNPRADFEVTHGIVGDMCSDRHWRYFSGISKKTRQVPHFRWPLGNVWLGVSVEDRRHGLPRIEQLRETPAAIRFLSIEPLLEDLGELDLRGISWVIVGGESGKGVRPMHPAWVRSIRDQCLAAGVAFHLKQWGHWLPVEDVGKPRQPEDRYLSMQFERFDFSGHPQGHSGYDPRSAWRFRGVGKKAAGAELDGREWREFPEVHP